MADSHTKQQRSRNMAAIKSKGNLSTEITFMHLLKANSITGWRRHYERLPGKPDFAFAKEKVAVFIDGCFWHGCPRCKLGSKSNKSYWVPKIERNRHRDKQVKREIRKKGWTVIRIWEHQIENKYSRLIVRVQNALIEA